ncbi:MAG: hypothetical protein GEU93_16925 [Propionibacteriales bacterium]|nr:hypothetical protein [Propionibacteriales bacterium]
MDDAEREPVGSLGDEAAKLIGALQGWAREHAADGIPQASGLASAYIADDSAACKVCPLCRLIAAGREINPQTIEQVGGAVASVLHSVADIIESAQDNAGRRHDPVEKIDLSDNGPKSPS